MSANKRNIPLPVRALSISLVLFGVFALWGSLFLWGDGFILPFQAGVDYSFPVTDIVVHAPAVFLAAVGLWKLKRWGYVAAQCVAGFYIYASMSLS